MASEGLLTSILTGSIKNVCVVPLLYCFFVFGDFLHMINISLFKLLYIWSRLSDLVRCILSFNFGAQELYI